MGINSSVKQYLNTIFVKLYLSKGCCDTVASIETRLRAAIFRVLLHEACVFSNFYLRSTDEVIEETIF